MDSAASASTSSTPASTSQGLGEADDKLARTLKKKLDLDPEVIAQRRAEKAAKKAEQRAVSERAQHEQEQRDGRDEPDRDAKPEFLRRSLVALPPYRSVDNVQSSTRRSVKLMTWNMLAQALVRRTLFPGSDILKWKDRGHVLSQEFLYYAPDIACLQEVDKIEHHGQALTEAGYEYAYATGYPSKLHGLCVAWKKSLCELAGERVVRLDDAVLLQGDDNGEGKRTGCSRATRNIGLLAALRFKDGKGQAKGILVATHHLFWHARHVYERARQVAILLREIEAFRSTGVDGSWAEWPCFLAGDFNIQPSEATYALLAGADLTPDQKAALEISTVVHSSFDQYRRKQALEAQSLGACHGDGAKDGEAAGGDDDETDGEAPAGEEYAQPEGDEDRVLKNTRPAREGDGLFSLEELKQAYAPWRGRLTSVYGTYARQLQGQRGNYFGERNAEGTESPAQQEDLDEDALEKRIRTGYYEPAYTNVTPLWRCTLDYIFIIPPASRGVDDDDSSTASSKDTGVVVTHLLPPHRLGDLEPGLPRKGKEPSDHIAIMAQLEL